MNVNHRGMRMNGLAESPRVNGERRTIPFDYAFRYQLEGKREKVHNETVTVSIEASFTALSIGYGVVPHVEAIKFGFLPESVLAAARSPVITIPLETFFNTLDLQHKTMVNVLSNLPDVSNVTGTVAAQLYAMGPLAAAAEALNEGTGAVIGPLTATLLKNGIKLNPAFAEKILLAINSGAPLDSRIVAEAFQAVAAPPDRIQFLYSIFDEGSGREFQSEPILNIAGLGASDGGRPFRYFAKPIVFAPQSTIRMQVTEVSEFEGELHVSLQGYKTLGTPGTPTGPRQVRRGGRVRR